MKTKAQIKSEQLKAVLEEGRARRKGLRGIDKKSVTVHKSSGDGEASTGSVTKTPGMPTAEQVAEINKFTRTPKTADELYVLHTMSANTLPDRDDDYFDEKTLKDFAQLEQPYSSVGKSYMVGHDYSQLPTGRIFGVGTEQAEGATFLTNEVYIARTPSNTAFIEAVDFGINWAVSVGVLLDAQLCSICASPQYGGWFYGGVCENGHFKSAYYDPSSDETDKDGYALELSPEDPSAVKCLGNMNGAKDFYELSQVFLGAQFFAGLDQSKGVVKALKSVKVPLLGLSRDEAAELPLQHTNPKVAAAISRYEVQRDPKSGTCKWTDDQSLIWTYTPGEEVMCLGKSAGVTNQEGEADGEVGTSDGSLPGEESASSSSGEVGGSDAVAEPEHGGPGLEASDGDASGVGDHSAAELGSGGDLTESSTAAAQEATNAPELAAAAPSTTTSHGEGNMSKSAIQAALTRCKAPSPLLSALDGAADDANALDAVLSAATKVITDLGGEVTALRPKAAAGENYITSLRADAIAAYVRAKGMGKQQGVDTTGFEKMLDRFGDDVDLIKSITDDYVQAAGDSLPAGTRRSSFPDDPHYRESTDSTGKTAPERPTGRIRASAVSRLHG